MVTIDAGQPADFSAVTALLEDVGLPVEGLADHFANALVAHNDGAVVGSAALELYGAAALLRSVAVAPSHRGQGVGERLVYEALDRAREQGVTQVFLLTTSAGDYFPRFGFQPVERAVIPNAVNQSLEFTSLCPASALVMGVNL